MGKYSDLEGKRFGRLIVIEKYSDFYETKSGKKYRNPTYLCKCDCGNEKIIPASSLISGSTKSCGCYSSECAKRAMEKLNQPRIKSEEFRTRVHRIWSVMINRCYNEKNNRYKYYGGRGITVCEEWKNDFMLFYDWAMSHGYANDLTIDRIDVNGNYCPENCRWITNLEQQRNRRDNTFVTYKGETKTVPEWSEITGIRPSVIHSRLKLGWELEDTFTKEVSAHSMQIEYDGEIFSASQFAKKIGISENVVRTRLKNGYTPEEIVKYRYSIVTKVKSPKERR